MKQPSNQLKETIKILTGEFLNSIDKLCSLHKQKLVYTKNDIIENILELLELQNKGSKVQSYFNILEQSIDDVAIKKQYFQKDFQFHSSSARDESIKNEQINESIFVQNKDKKMNIDKLKKQIMKLERQNQTTKFHKQKNGLFQQAHHLDIKKEKYYMQVEQNDQQQSEYSSITDQSIFTEKQEQQSQNIKLNKNNIQIQTSRYYQLKKKYRSYTENERKAAIQQAKNIGLENASRLLNIPKKNISRWMTRKEKVMMVRGRKPGNPEMQENLTRWIKQNIDKSKYITQTQIRNKAKQYSNDLQFKASKGWLQKFFKRNHKISQQLGEMLRKKRNQHIEAAKNQKIVKDQNVLNKQN